MKNKQAYKWLLTVNLVIAILFTPVSLKSQSNWQLKKNKDSIKIYTRGVTNKDLKEVMVTFKVLANPDSIAEAIINAEIHKKWMEGLMVSKLLEEVNQNEFIYYLEFDFPWPANNRDVITRVKIHRDTNNIVTQITTQCVLNYLPKKEGIVRITQYEGTWVFNQLSSGKVEVVHVLFASPGGSLPNWIINMFIIDQPYESHRKLNNYLKEWY